VLLAFLRDADVPRGACSELFEHIAVSLPAPALCDHVDALKHAPRIRGDLQGMVASLLTEERCCTPTGPASLQHSNNNNLPHHYKRLKGIRGDGSHEEASEDVERVFFGGLAFGLYINTLTTTPALSRAWFTNADRAAAHHIAALTAKYVSPLLVARELRDVNRGPKKPKAAPAIVVSDGVQRPAPGVEIRDAGEEDDDVDEMEEVAVEDVEVVVQKKEKEESSSDDGEEEEVEEEDDEVEFKISGIISKSEVVAKYVRGEIALSMAIRLDATHPLVPASVELIDAVKVKEARARKWQIAIASMLNSRNGSIREAVMVWRRSVDRQFQGVEECPVCYSVTDATRALPRMQCSTCKNKFHSGCLYKWFNSSGNSKCPMCRALF
jgi:hypothetical protein